jgi:hypothetical protein
MIRCALCGLAAAAAGLTVAASGRAGGFPDGVEDEVRIRVVSDLNGDGLSQDNEPGLAHYSVHGGCSDAIRPFTTDEDGYIYTEGGSIFVDNCFEVARDFGWLPTTPLRAELPSQFEGDRELEFLLHDLGDAVMEISGEALVDGLPATELRLETTAPPFEGDCIERFYSIYPPVSPVTVIVVGDDQRDDCPSRDDEFSIVFAGDRALTAQFAPGASMSGDLIVGAESMRFYAESITGAEVLEDGVRVGEDCAVVVPIEGMWEDRVRVFVLPDAVRGGCGAPDRHVRLIMGSYRLRAIAWNAGDHNPGPSFSGILPPQTGTGAGDRRSLAGAQTALAVAGAMAITLALCAIPRRRQ